MKRVNESNDAGAFDCRRLARCAELRVLRRALRIVAPSINKDYGKTVERGGFSVFGTRQSVPTRTERFVLARRLAVGASQHRT